MQNQSTQNNIPPKESLTEIGTHCSPNLINENDQYDIKSDQNSPHHHGFDTTIAPEAGIRTDRKRTELSLDASHGQQKLSESRVARLESSISIPPEPNPPPPESNTTPITTNDKQILIIQNAIETVVKEDEKLDGDHHIGAKNIFGLKGLHPSFWGISKEQFQDFVNIVRIQYDEGKFINEHGDDPQDKYYYDSNVFNDPKRGPNMHQVNAQLIQPHTKNFEVKYSVREKKLVLNRENGNKTVNVPCLSYSLQQNLYTGGLECDVFFSHAWNEPFFEAANQILKAWPEDCVGGYICSLCNPQNLNIGQLLGSSVDNSPFYRILTQSPVRELLIVPNSQIPIHRRLWCVLEAHIALKEKHVYRVRITGQPHHLLTGEDANFIKKEMDLATEEMTLYLREVDILASKFTSGKMNNKEYWSQAEHIQNDIDKVKLRMYRCQSKVLNRYDTELINLDEADASMAEDKRMIEKYIAGSEEEVCRLVANLLRNHIKASWEVAVGVAEDRYQMSQRDVVKKFTGLWQAVPGGETVGDCPESRERLTKWIKNAVHVVPVGLVQFSDYVSDIFVVLQLYHQGGPEWIIGISAMGASILIVWVGAFIGIIIYFIDADDDERRLKGIVNLGVIILLAPLNLHVLYIGMQDVKIFALFKVLESSTESIVMAFLTFAVILNGSIAEDNTLFLASFSLSVLSISYSYAMFLIDENTKNPIQTFCCILVHVCWEVMSIGSVIALEPNHLGWLALAFFWFVDCVIMFVSLFEKTLSVKKLCVYVPLSVVLSVVNSTAFFLGDTLEEYCIFSSITRRVALMAIGIYAITLSSSSAVIIIMCTLFAVDTVCLSQLWYLRNDVNWSRGPFQLVTHLLAHLLFKKEQGRSVQKTYKDYQEIDSNVMGPDFRPASSSAVISIMLDAILLEKGDKNNELIHVCQQIKEKLAQMPSKLSPATQAGIIQSLHVYKPRVMGNESPEPDLKLLESLQECLTDDYLPGLVPEAVQVTEEPFHVVSLAVVPHMWEPSRFTDSPMELSTMNKNCDYFVSHFRDLQHETSVLPRIQDYLIVHSLVAHATAVLMTIALFMLPLGAAIPLESVPFWWLSMIIVSLLALVWIWVLLSKHTSLVPQKMRPWALSQCNLWIDRYCIDRSSISGMCSIGSFIGQSHNMIAYVDYQYFTDLRCIYELAIFCKLNLGSKLAEKLTIMSNNWGGIWLPWKNIALTNEEEEWLRDFHFDRARCAVPAERQILASAIQDVWGSLAEFEHFVHTELLSVFEKSKEQYSQQPKMVAAEALNHIFVA